MRYKSRVNYHQEDPEDVKNYVEHLLKNQSTMKKW